MKIKVIFLLFLLTILFFSCITSVINPYNNICQFEDNENLTYLINPGEKRVLIYIDGSGLNSVLGIVKNKVWVEVGFSYYLSKYFDNDISIVVPEKLYFKKGNNYSANKLSLIDYTVENLVKSYSQKIDKYIELNNQKEIYLFGISEGGLLAPKILNNIKYKDKIKKMVIWGAGGFDQAESFRVLSKSNIKMPKNYKEKCSFVDNIIEDIKKHPNSIDRYYFGWTYNRWESFFKYKPINEYQTIDIPVLFIQGVADYNSPYESVKYIEENIPNNKYQFQYYQNMGHIPEKDKEIKEILDYIFLWLKSAS